MGSEGRSNQRDNDTTDQKPLIETSKYVAFVGCRIKYVI
jgi:hypothetical protein